MVMKAVCDKCGKEVPENNDATIFWSFVLRDPTLCLNLPRHLLPTEHCEGSPSRAQYLEGQPRDTRRYVYDKRYETIIREKYVEYRKLYK